MTDDGVPFGAAAYDALRRLSGFECLASQLNYAAIQALTSADREGTARIFAGCGPDIGALIASGEPEAVARQLLLAREAKAERGVLVAEVLQILVSLLGA